MNDALDDAYEAIKYDPAFHALQDFHRNAFVPGEGVLNPQAFIIGEAPNAVEASFKRPAHGNTGRVTRDLMSLAGLNSDPWVHMYGIHANCWLTNVCKYRPPMGRGLTPEEVAASRPHLRREWQAVGSPRVIVTLGGAALAAISGHRITNAILNNMSTLGEVYAQQSKDGTLMFIWPMIPPTHGLLHPKAQPLIEKQWERLGVWLAETKGHPSA
jgi:uracil-DNA glycosylase family 4